MTPYEHSVLSVRDFGGKAEDYIKIHEFLDQTKFHYPDWRHRAILHNGFGMGLCEQVIGYAILNSDGNFVSTREVARKHIGQDLNGFIPTIKDWLVGLSRDQEWMNTPSKADLSYLKMLKK